MAKLLKWRSHKIVRASKIKNIIHGKAMSSMRLEDEDGNDVVYDVETEKVFARGKPQIGDYFVIYDDGHQSWSPATAFEEGYTLIPKPAPDYRHGNPTTREGLSDLS